MRTLAALASGAVVGTSSLRREAQLRERFPALVVKPLRGNVNTRLRKLDEGQYDGIILAAAGLKRLGLGDRIADLIDPADSLPATGQGALAIECRADRPDLLGALEPLADRATTLATTAERAFSRALAGNCHTARRARRMAWRRCMRGLVASVGREVMRGEVDEAIEDVDAEAALGSGLADDFVARAASATSTRDRSRRRSSSRGRARQAAPFAQHSRRSATPIVWPAIVILPPSNRERARAHAALITTPRSSSRRTRRWRAAGRSLAAALKAYARSGTAAAIAAVGVLSAHSTRA